MQDFEKTKQLSLSLPLENFHHLYYFQISKSLSYTVMYAEQ